MSRRHDIQSADGIVVASSPAAINFVIRATAPTASAAGFAPRCLYVNTAGSAGSSFYINHGTVTSATWVAIA